METMEKTKITVAVQIQAPVEKVWECFTDPRHIVRWNQASDDWFSPLAENDVRQGGRFNTRMEAKNQSAGFNFTGTYTRVELYRAIEYTMDDNRTVQISFEQDNGSTKLVETFEAEKTHSLEMQREGWQSILNSFKNYVEGPSRFGKLQFKILIHADADKVYRTMLEKDTYAQWTAPFNPSSRYEGTWEKGSRILFIGEDQEGNKGGMISRIKENIPNRFISIQHLGMFQGDKEITSGPEVEKWAGGLENYTFERQDDKTLVVVDIDVTSEFESYFDETWPKALNKLKEICESR